VRGYHQMKTRYSGTKAFIQMHIDLDDSLSFLQAHEIAESLEHALEEAFPGADVILHQDPVRLEHN
jgi:ferrous-iron efflux pump FieF